MPLSSLRSTSALRAVPRRRWPIVALLAGSLVATILALTPARADALPASETCGPTGFILCHKIEIGISPITGLWELRAFLPGWFFTPIGF
ncbi:MAG: hypothetical protein SFW08_13265 [Gemmatimonadaceae bacterium]|nr:hypothetical protein [Gemmatimonadaceae bacterium]